jgi:KDO2-lipid IV(A) lauroyltransferase
MPKRFLQNYLEYTLFLALIFVVKALPRSLALRIGAGLGLLSKVLLPKRRKRALENMRMAYPLMPEEELRNNVSEMFRHLGISGVEMLLLDTFKTKKDLEKYFSFHGLEHLREAYKLNKGVFLLSGHLGSWEVGTFFLPMLGCPADFVAKQMKNPFVGRYFNRLREAGGGRVLDAKHGARRIVKSLSENRAVAILLDQHTTPSVAVKVNFFGRPAYTTPIITQIAMKNGVPIVPCFTHRTKDNRYEIVFEPMILLAPDTDREAVVRNTALLTSIIEDAVRRDITQWFWVHRRWRE